MGRNCWYLKLVVSFVLVVSYFILPRYGFTTFDGFLSGSFLLSHLLYPLSHANIWHLMANIVCLCMMPCKLNIFTTFAIAVLCSFLPCFVSEPTMGFSGVLFAMVGISWGRVNRFKDMIWKNKWFLIIPIFIPHVNAFIHIYCLLAGYLYGNLCARKFVTS